jgi:adenine-specific DNA-methyltransferase
VAKIEELVRQISDAKLRDEIATEIKELKKQKRFGLVFEEHLPEMLRLPKATIRLGNLVAHRDAPGSEVWRVIGINGKKAKCRQPLTTGKYDQEIVKEFPLEELVLVVSFGEPIYPILTPIDRVQRGGPDKPWHVLINADNYHALQLLLYSHERKIDVIYIDPPYNTGARDWKYNNDYVDKTDAWRHSKWLSMMKKRLSLARRLLKPNGVFVITIDDNESHHLRSLIEEMFPSALVHQITVVINPGGTYRINFARVHEYALYVCPNAEEVVQPAPIDRTTETTWKLRRTGSESSKRHQRPNQFYPIVVDKKTTLAKRVGPALPVHEKWRPYENDREVHVYPIDSKGVERVWRYAGETMMKHVLAGNVYGRKQPGGWNCYLRKEQAATARLKTMWYQGEHSSVGTAGIVLVDTILQSSAAFSFPKSLYLVRDSLAAIVRDKRDAVILDFFAGSGTTLHATALLNDEDDGRRQCILVTNMSCLKSKLRRCEMTGCIQAILSSKNMGFAKV